MPRMREGSVEQRVVRTIFNRYHDVSITLDEQPHAYRPIFMINEEGRSVAHTGPLASCSASGCAPEVSSVIITLTEHCRLLTPIFVHHDLGAGLLPEVPPAECDRPPRHSLP
jgi:hypothetical protein